MNQTLKSSFLLPIYTELIVWNLVAFCSPANSGIRVSTNSLTFVFAGFTVTLFS